MTQQRAEILDRPRPPCAAASMNPVEAHRTGIQITLERLNGLRDGWLAALPGVRREFSSLCHQIRLFASIYCEAQRLYGCAREQIELCFADLEELAHQVARHQRDLHRSPVDFPFFSAMDQIQCSLKSTVLVEGTPANVWSGLGCEVGRLLAYARYDAFLDAGIPPATDLAGRVVVVYERDPARSASIAEALLQGGCGDVSVLDSCADAQRLVRSREPSALVVGWAAPGFSELLMDGFRCRGIGTVLSVDRQLADGVSRFSVDLGVSRILAMPASPSRIVDAVVGAIDGYYPSETAEGLGL